MSDIIYATGKVRDSSGNEYRLEVRDESQFSFDHDLLSEFEPKWDDVAEFFTSPQLAADPTDQYFGEIPVFGRTDKDLEELDQSLKDGEVVQYGSYGRQACGSDPFQVLSERSFKGADFAIVAKDKQTAMAMLHDLRTRVEGLYVSYNLYHTCGTCNNEGFHDSIVTDMAAVVDEDHLTPLHFTAMSKSNTKKDIEDCLGVKVVELKPSNDVAWAA